MKRKVTYQVGVTDDNLDWSRVEEFVRDLEASPSLHKNCGDFLSSQNFVGSGKSLIHRLADGTPHLVEIVWEDDK